MRLLIIRHGESEADILNVHEGRADFELTERGRKQAQAMAEFVKENYKVDKIYCSTLKRAYGTAEHLSWETGIELIPDDRLREFNNGLLAGLPFEEATVAIVTHGGMILQLYRSFLRLPVDSNVVVATGDTGIHEWYLGEKENYILRANMTEHTKGI